MVFITLAIAALILLPAVGLIGLAWFSMAEAEEDLRAFSEPARRR